MFVFLIIKVIAFVILLIILSLVVILILPIKYELRGKIEDKVISINFSYIVFLFDFYFDLKNIKSLKCKASVFGKSIFDSAKKVKNENKSVASSIRDTDFIKNKELENEVNVDKKVFENLFKRSKEYERKLNEARNEKEKIDIRNTEVINRITGFLDIYKSSLPQDILDATKILTNEVVKYYKYIMPKKFSLNITIGLDDPYMVGVILSYFAIIYGKYGDSIEVSPYFDRNVLYGEFHIIGAPQLIYMLILIVHLFVNKRFRQILSNLKSKNKRDKNN